MSDRPLLYAAACVRSAANGMIGVLMGVYLAERGFGAARSGAIIGAGLLGGAVAALLVTVSGDRLGRRRSLIVLALLSAAGGAAFAWAPGPWTAAAAAFAGMVNGMGRDRGASLILDQAILPATVPPERRTATFAWYNLLQDLGGAFGGLLAGLPALLRAVAPEGGAGSAVGSLRLSVLAYAALLLLPALLYPRLSAAVETAPAAGDDRRVSPATRRILWRIGGLFAFDSLAGGFLTTALVSYFFYERFAVGEGTLGALFFGARLLNAASHLAAAWLARRIGLVNTMVFTHTPSSLLLVTVAYAPSFEVAAILFLLREGLVEMDVPTRQSYVMAMVRPAERTLASGVTHLVRVGAWAVAPTFAGMFMQSVSLHTPLLIGAAMKIVYDALLFTAFRRMRPPEEGGEMR
ncbi:MAG: MFS transporter [Candidatus Polarisedimenticolia bacterium]